MSQVLAFNRPAVPPPVPVPAVDEQRALEELLRRNPDDRASRIRLIDLYFQQGREADFLREATLFRNALKGNLDTTDWQAIKTIGMRLFPASPVFADGARAVRNRRLGEDQKSKPRFQQLAKDYEGLRADPKFLNELDRELLSVADRPTPLAHARRLSERIGGAQIWFKREDLAPPGARLQISILGQALLARRLGKLSLVTGTVYGQRGVVLAETAARLGFRAVIYMDPRQMAREPANVFRMWLTGADVRAVDVEKLRDQDVREAAVQHWLADPDETMPVLGLDGGPEPYPAMARDFMAVIGRECRRQALAHTHGFPDLVVARAGDSADAIGLFQPFLAEPRTRLVCVEGSRELPGAVPAKDDLSAEQRRLSDAILEDTAHVSVIREHAWLKSTGRVEYHRMDGESARETISLASHLEGLVPAIETAHAVAWACRAARAMRPDQMVVVALCERADKDILKIGRSMGVPL